MEVLSEFHYASLCKPIGPKHTMLKFLQSHLGESEFRVLNSNAAFSHSFFNQMKRVLQPALFTALFLQGLRTEETHALYTQFINFKMSLWTL